METTEVGSIINIGQIIGPLAVALGLGKWVERVSAKTSANANDINEIKKLFVNQEGEPRLVTRPFLHDTQIACQALIMKDIALILNNQEQQHKTNGDLYTAINSLLQQYAVLANELQQRRAGERPMVSSDL